jgi:hypothetical protein
MSSNNSARKCSAVNQNGQPCQAWAMRDSNPPLCSVHSGRNQGAGAPAGNRNALKHGYYTRHFTDLEIGDIEAMSDRSLKGELVGARVILGRLMAYFFEINSQEDVNIDEVVSLGGLINSSLRTVVYIVKGMADETDDIWDEVLDSLSEEWGIDL